jgi:hypothetical protein
MNSYYANKSMHEPSGHCFFLDFYHDKYLMEELQCSNRNETQARWIPDKPHANELTCFDYCLGFFNLIESK